MHSLKTEHPIALSLLLDDEIYVFGEEKTVEAQLAAPQTTEIPKETEETVPVADVIKEKPSFKYLGENNKYILIILNDPDVEFVNQTDLIFLLKILAAKQLELKDIAIVNTAHYSSMDFDTLKDFFACSRVLTFGINPAILNVHGLKANQVLEYNGVKFLGTWSLRQMVNDDNKKRVYWQILKPF